MSENTQATEQTPETAAPVNDSLPESQASADTLYSQTGTTALAEIGEQRTSIRRVIDVPLTVTLRFGQRQMTLRELLDLNTGSLVELDQEVEEPVHLMLGERVIARGEVVIVDGNYGMRVLEVIESPAQRLASVRHA